MPRNSGGAYTLPPSNPVVPFTTIASAWANATFADVASELTNSLDRGGRGGMVGPLKIIDGAVNVPGLSFGEDTNTGAYREAADKWWLVAGGNPIFSVSVLGGTTSLAAGDVTHLPLHWEGDSDTGIYSPALNITSFVANGVEVLRIDGNTNTILTQADTAFAIGGQLGVRDLLAKAVLAADDTNVVAQNAGTGILSMIKKSASDPTQPGWGILYNLDGDLLIQEHVAGGAIRFTTGTTDTEVLQIGAYGHLLAGQGMSDSSSNAQVRINNSACFNTEYNAGSVSGTTGIDFKNGNKQKCSLSGNWTPAFTFPGVGNYQLTIVSGTNTITWPTIGATWRWLGSNTAPSVSTGSEGGVLTMYYNGTRVLASYSAIGATVL